MSEIITHDSSVEQQNAPSLPERAHHYAGEADTPLCSPAFIALLTLMAGPHIALFPGWKILSKLRAGIRAKLVLTVAAVAYPALYVYLVLWPTDWYWSSLALIAAHFLAAGANYLYFRRLYLSRKEEYHTGFAESRTSTNRFVVTGIAGGMFLIPVLGVPFIIFFLLGVDRLLSSLMPVAFDDTLSVVLLGFGVLSLGITGAIAGGRIGRLGLRIKPLQFICYAASLVWIVLLWFFILQLTIVLPGFLTVQIDNSELVSPFTLFLFGNLLVGSWWSTSLLLYALRPLTAFGKALRLLQIPAISLSSAFIFSLVCGYSSNWFHSAGNYFEKEGSIATSLWCYERGMSKTPSGLHASYLQYRIALLAHKLGERDKAIDGFRKVVSMYDSRDDLVQNSTKFLDNLERNSEPGTRVVLPGVETSTDYKGGYCVPNSLALVMRYWGATVDAKEIGQAITGLTSGTTIVDEAWFAEQKGFRHDFLPTATLADIIACIDAGFPVLVYVPAHVFAIVGYDRTLETFVTYDVATSDIWVDYLQKDFVRSWKKEDTTMVIVYPPDKADKLPATVRTALAGSSGQYLQYHLHYLDSPEGYVSADHLMMAMDGSSQFFLPLVTAYQEYPSLRAGLQQTRNVEGAVSSIVNYFDTDFDEGTHLAGQINEYDYPQEDEKLESSLNFLVGTGHFEKASLLIEEIGSKGLLSDNTLETQAMLDISLGDFDRAIPRLTKLDDSQLHFYLAQSYLRQGNVAGAIAGLVKTIDGCT